MSVAVRFERLIPSVVTESTPSPTYRPPHAEAPDCGGHACEAPEMHHDRTSEPLEVGDGRSSYLESQFTHGRSQS